MALIISALPKTGRIKVHIGDLVMRGPRETAIVAVDTTAETARLINTVDTYGGWRGTMYREEVLQYHGIDDDGHHIYSLPDDWRVSDDYWGDGYGD